MKGRAVKMRLRSRQGLDQGCDGALLCAEQWRASEAGNQWRNKIRPECQQEHSSNNAEDVP